MEELKSCPFCGGKAELVVIGRLAGCCKIKCTECSIEASYSYVGKAIKAWNTRPKEEKGGAIAEALEMLTRLINSCDTEIEGDKFVFDALAKIRSTLKGQDDN